MAEIYSMHTKNLYRYSLSLLYIKCHTNCSHILQIVDNNDTYTIFTTVLLNGRKIAEMSALVIVYIQRCSVAANTARCHNTRRTAVHECMSTRPAACESPSYFLKDNNIKSYTPAQQSNGVIIIMKSIQL